MTTVNLKIAAAIDDGGQYGGAPYNDTNYVYLSYGDATQNLAAFRFTGALPPQGATIGAATLAVAGYTAGTIHTVVYGEDADAAETIPDGGSPSGTGDALNTRALTTASTTWGPETISDPDTAYNTVDVTAIVQEIVNRAGYSAAALCLICVDPQSTVTGRVFRYRGSAAYAAELDITYSAGGQVAAISDLAAAAPTLGTPAIAQAFTAGIPDLVADAPLLGSPAAGQSSETRILIDWAADGSFTGTYDDVTADQVGGITTSHGISDPLDRIASVGSANFVLDNSAYNSHGEAWLYSPENAAGSLYGSLLPRRKVRIEVGGVIVWTGYVASITPNPADFTVTIECVDEMSRLLRPTVNIAIQVDQTVDAIVAAILGAIGTFTTRLSTGKQMLPYVGDTWERGSTTAYDAIRGLMLAEWGRFWAAADGALVMWNTHDEFMNITPSATFDKTMIGLDIEYSEETIANRVEVAYTPREVGTDHTVLWQHRSDLEVAAGAVETVEAKFSAPEGGRTIGALTVDAMAAGTDYAPTPSGLAVSAEATASGATITVDNSARSSPVTLTTLQVRGTPLYTYDQSAIAAEDAASQAAYDRRDTSVKLDAGGSPTFAGYLARHLLTLYKAPHTFVGGLTVSNLSDAATAALLSLDVGDVITLTEDATGLSAANYLIIHVAREIEGGRHVASYGLAPYAYPQYLIVGDAAMGVIGANVVGPF
jgi:hypothetical protein